MKKASQYITLLTVMTTLVIGFYSMTWPYSASAIAFLLWAISPYMLLSMLINLVSSRAAIMAAFIITLLTCLAGLALLVDAIFIHTDAQSALVFAAAPLWQWAALIFLSIPLTLFNLRQNTKHKKS